MAGITLRLARSPDAPKRTTVHGSTTVPYPVGLFCAGMNSPLLCNISNDSMPPPSLAGCGAARRARKLYLNTEGFQLRTQLLGIPEMNRVHTQAAGAFEVHSAVVNKHTLRGGTLGDRQGHAKNQLFGFTRVHVAGAEKHLEVVAEMKGLDAVLVEFERFVVDGPDKIFGGVRDGVQNGARFGVFLGLR